MSDQEIIQEFKQLRSALGNDSTKALQQLVTKYENSIEMIRIVNVILGALKFEIGGV